MKADKAIATYRRMRAQPLWRLLASTTGPTVIGLLQSHLYESERSLPASIFHERIARDLEELRAQGEDFPQTAQAYVASWLADGFLERRFPAGASEEEYELSTATVEAIRFVSGLAQPHSAATESRLTLVIEALARLAEDTDTDKFRRIDRLMTEQARIDKEIDAIQKGQMRVLPHTTALERTREIITLADDLAGDFRRVRDQFDQLNRDPDRALRPDRPPPRLGNRDVRHLPPLGRNDGAVAALRKDVAAADRIAAIKESAPVPMAAPMYILCGLSTTISCVAPVEYFPA